MLVNHKDSIGKALKTLQYKCRNGSKPEQAIKVGSFVGFVSYLNGSSNWNRISEGWKNKSNQLIITNSTKGFVLHRVH